MTPESWASVGLDLSLPHNSNLPPDSVRSAAERERNRRRFIEQLGASAFSLAMLRQIHSTHAFEVHRKPDGELDYQPAGAHHKRQAVGHSMPRSWKLPTRGHAEPFAGDALLTREPGILL
jgi:copper oxidase (laccase) domain-containing protein